MTTQPSDLAVAPKFGEWLRGIYASERNPYRDGMYVRTIRRTGRCNPGTYFELTDGKGNFWQYPRDSVIRMDRARELDASGDAPRAAEAGDWLPIESAPRDGTYILLGYSGSHSEEGRWVYDASRNHWGETGWFATDDDVLCEHPSKPTHWRPMPEPPAMGAVGAGGGE